MPALFYHLTRSTEEALIRMLIERSLAQGWRVMLRGTDDAALRRMDTRLWTEGEGSFLPHGMEGGPQDCDQPVLIGKGSAVNAAHGVILTGGAVADADEAKGLERLWVLFDGADEAAVQGARALWRQLTGAGVDAEYWSEDSGKWVRTAEKKAAAAT
jgi:DNA polymerase-3 subunit chi